MLNLLKRLFMKLHSITIPISQLEEALEQARGDEVFIAGGADLYRQTMERLRRLYLTRIDRAYEGDTFFPEVDLSGWKLVVEEHHPATATEPPFSFLTYER